MSEKIKEQELIDSGLLTKADQRLLSTRPKPRSLTITFTNKEENELREYLEDATAWDHEHKVRTPPVVSDLLEGLIQAKDGREVDYLGTEL